MCKMIFISRFTAQFRQLMNSMALLTLFGLLMVSSHAQADSNNQSAVVSVPAAEHDALFVQEWMQLLYERVGSELLSPPEASRIYAYAGITLYEAVVAGMPDHRSLSGQIQDMPAAPLPDAETIYDWPSVVNGALANVTKGLIPLLNVQLAADRLRDEQAAARETTVPAEVVEQSLAYGNLIGQTILEWAATDGYQTTRFLEFTPPTGDPSYWQPARNQRALEPYWPTLRPFALAAADVCDVPTDVPFDLRPASAFYAEANEVYTIGKTLTDEQRAIALFWADNTGETGTPPGHWVMLENLMVDQLGLSLDRASEMYALTGIALADSFISSWETKFRVNLLRPETYIRSYIDDKWRPYIPTPPFPEYPSGHSVASGAAETVLTQLLGTVAFTDTTHQSRGLAERSFESLRQAADEAAISRLYGGIHFRAGIEQGFKQGQCVGQNVLDSIQLNGE